MHIENKVLTKYSHCEVKYISIMHILWKMCSIFHDVFFKLKKFRLMWQWEGKLK